MKKEDVYAGFFGLSIGDALGVPVEFRSREYLSQEPVEEMIGWGTHNQPPGTWSDDSSLTFCLAESLCSGYNPEDAGKTFISWMDDGWWTPRGSVFDIGNQTCNSIRQLKRGIPPAKAGGIGERSNGNGSLMRILPLVFYCSRMPVTKRFDIVSEISSITHRHKRAVIGCILYVEAGCSLLAGSSIPESVENASRRTSDFFHGEPELRHYKRIIHEDLSTIPEDDIRSGGYAVDTLEAAFWTLLTTSSYREAVLKAVNLGGDTDTTGAVTGGLAGVHYGFDQIPKAWMDAIARKEDIRDLCDRFYLSCRQ